MGQALYRKYRSTSLSEIVGQEHITQTLKQAVDTGRISHAYLFTGPRGVGKTSIARILAHDINGIKYNDPAYSMDIIEIDAASNNGIEDIRELRDRTYIAPTLAKYKVYIIDEVHMLSKAAFNGLLKTLEEPPAHVVFILATTEVDKLPETIISRTQRFHFLPVKTDKVVAHLKYIAQQEKIEVEPEALTLIANYGQGSFRDSINLLDQAANYTKLITIESIGSLIGLPPEEAITSLVSDLAESPAATIINRLQDLRQGGYSANIIASKISELIRTQLINDRLNIDRDSALELLTNLIEIPSSNNSFLLLEITLLKAAKTKNKLLEQTNATNTPLKETKEDLIKPSLDKTVNNKPPTKDERTKASQSEVKATNDKTVTSGQGEQLDWSKVLDILRSNHNTLYGVIRMAEVDVSDPNVIKLDFAFAFHHKKVIEAKNRLILSEAAKQVGGRDYIIECNINKELLAKKPSTESITDDDVSVISKIFET